MILHVGIAFRVGSSLKVCLNHLWNISEWICSHVLHLGLGLHSIAPKLHIGYFETTIHVGIAFKVGFSFKVDLNHLWVILKQTWIWLLHLKLGIHIICNTYTLKRRSCVCFFCFLLLLPLTQLTSIKHNNILRSCCTFMCYIVCCFCFW